MITIVTKTGKKFSFNDIVFGDSEINREFTEFVEKDLETVQDIISIKIELIDFGIPDNQITMLFDFCNKMLPQYVELLKKIFEKNKHIEEIKFEGYIPSEIFEVLLDNLRENKALQSLKVIKREVLSDIDLCQLLFPSEDLRMQEMFSLLRGRQLRELSLSGLGIDDELKIADLVDVLNSISDYLEELDISNNPIKDNEKLIGFFNNAKVLKDLNISSCSFDPRFFIFLLQNTTIKNLKKIDISYNYYCIDCFANFISRNNAETIIARGCKGSHIGEEELLRHCNEVIEVALARGCKNLALLGRGYEIESDEVADAIYRLTERNKNFDSLELGYNTPPVIDEMDLSTGKFDFGEGIENVQRFAGIHNKSHKDLLIALSQQRYHDYSLFARYLEGTYDLRFLQARIDFLHKKLFDKIGEAGFKEILSNIDKSKTLYPKMTFLNYTMFKSPMSEPIPLRALVSDILERKTSSAKTTKPGVTEHINLYRIKKHIECGDLAKLKEVFNEYERSNPSYLYDIISQIVGSFIQESNIFSEYKEKCHCPISLGVITNPCALRGPNNFLFLFEREYLEQLIQSNATNPLTRSASRIADIINIEQVLNGQDLSNYRAALEFYQKNPFLKSGDSELTRFIAKYINDEALTKEFCNILEIPISSLSRAPSSRVVQGGASSASPTSDEAVTREFYNILESPVSSLPQSPSSRVVQGGASSASSAPHNEH